MSALRVFRNDVIDWVVAESPADADLVCLEHCGDPPDDPHVWLVLPEDRMLSIHTDDGRGSVEKTCAEWVAEQGRGFLASTEY